MRGLNPFFGTRTLTLVDSKRHVPTNNGNSVDLNAIPSVLIDRLEVVTGGASATYGSDAVSGVVNILLDKDLQGMKVDLDFGASDGDGDNSHVGIAGGTELFGGRGHIVVGGEYQKQDPILSCAHARDWCARSVGVWSNGGFPGQPVGTPYLPTIPGLPQNNILANRRANQSSFTGVIFNNVPGSTTTLQANAAGTGVVPFNIGQFGTFGLFTNEVGGDGRSIYDGVTMTPETERSNAMVSLTFDFTRQYSRLRRSFVRKRPRHQRSGSSRGVRLRSSRQLHHSRQRLSGRQPGTRGGGRRSLRQRQLLLVQQPGHVRARRNGRSQRLHARDRPNRQYR